MSQRRDTGGPAQALEFEIWADLIRQSHGLLHPFLPLLDCGLDAVLHHMTEGRYIPVQVKGRTLEKGKVQLQLQADSLVDDHALLIAIPVLDPPDQKDLVVEAGVFRQLASRQSVDGHDVYSAAFSMHPEQAAGGPI